MITADTLKRMTGFDAGGLTALIHAQGYKQDKFKDSRFLGITNAGEYCYEVLYFDDNLGEDAYTKVFVKHDQFEQTTVADY
jgi:hypothetical protein